MHVRPAQLTDAAEVIRLKRQLIESWPIPMDFSSDPGWEQRSREVFAQLIGSPHFGCFVVDHPEQPGALIAAGTCTLEQHLPAPGSKGLVAYLADMSVDPTWRGQGLGQLIIDASRDFAQHEGASWAHLYSTPGAHTLYERNGFDASNERFIHMTAMWSGPPRCCG